MHWLRLVDPSDAENDGDEYANEENADNEGADGHMVTFLLFECENTENGRVQTEGN